MKKLVIATHNHGKFREVSEALTSLGLELIPAYDFQGVPDVVEDGHTLEENSLKKARELSAFTHLPTLSDDTGLFVDALNGQPGIYAARFAGEGCSYEDNIHRLLDLMQGVPIEKRSAVFRTVITLFHPHQSYQQVVGEIEGTIAESPRGTGGFGYDPVFQPKGYSKVFSEMTLEEKNKCSHRGLAIQKARMLLKKENL